MGGLLMKKLLVLLLSLSLAFCCACQSDTDTATDLVPNEFSDTQFKKYKSQRIIDDFKNKYSAVELELYNEGHSKFSSEITDNFKGKNIYSSLFIEDIFYSGNDLYMYAEILDDSKLLFKLTQEQYSAIQSMYDNRPTYQLHAIFTIDNIEPMLPTMEADFEFYISGPDDVSSDEYASISLDSRIIHGTLVDIIDVQ